MAVTSLPEIAANRLDPEDDTTNLLRDRIRKSRERDTELRERIAFLEQTYEEQSQPNAEFLAELAHELGNYICPLSLALEVFGRSRKERAVSQYLLETMEAVLPQLKRFVEKIQNLARQERAKRGAPKEVTSIAALVERTIHAIRPLARDRQHNLIVRMPTEPTDAMVDVGAVEQAIMNLLNNAVKYTYPGGQVEVDTEREDTHIIIRVRDTGIGMTDETLSKAFEMFERGDQRTRTGLHGDLGIGLAFAKRVVELNGGSITGVSHGIGRGSEFTVRIPAAAPPATW